MQTTQVFHPKATSRQGERNAWILTGFALIAELLLFWRSSVLPGWMTLLTFFLLLSAISISLSNWVDRKTILTLEPDGIAFRNGLRNVCLNWDEIERINVTTDRWGRRVHISGAETGFNFRMLSEIEFQGKLSGQMGFAEGETILKEILHTSGLSLEKTDDQGHYYARP